MKTPDTIKRWWLIPFVSIVMVLICTLEFLDQWEGGPLGRSYPLDGGIETVPVSVGESVLFVDGEIENKTMFPYHIWSVTPIDVPSGLSIKSGVVINPPSGMEVLPEQYQQGTYTLVKSPVSVPGHAGESVAADRVAPALKAIASKPGTYDLHGFWVTYRWGPLIYKAKYLALEVKLEVK